MTTPKAIIVAGLFLSGALLLSTHYVVAGFIANAERSTYRWALDHAGLLLPVCAWLCFGIGALVALLPLLGQSKTKLSEEKRDA